MRRTREAFTLVELLVVISIIGVLAAILLPAVNAARGAARKTECTNNLRNLAQATLNFESAKGQLPAYLYQITQTTNNQPVLAGALYQILPFIEQSVLKDDIDNTVSGSFSGYANPQSTAQVSYFNCPSDPALSARKGRTNYVSNAGNYENGFRSNGAFSLQVNDQLAIGQQVYGTPTNSFGVTLDYVSSRDGTTMTSIFSENVRYSESKSNWLPFAGGAGQAKEKVISPLSIVWSQNVFGNWKNRFSSANVDFSQQGGFGRTEPRGNDRLDATPSSLHAGGFVVAFADSHVTFVNSTVDYHVYASMLTSNGRETNPNSNGTYQTLALSGADFQQ